MSEIVVGDVLAWEQRLKWDGDEAELQRPLSWAVTIRATFPALPPLRGGELIVLPQRTLEDLRRTEMVGWPDVVRLLSAQPVSGLVVDSEFVHPPIPGVPLLRATADFIGEAEPYLNRTITEHRAELYRMGSDLSRALSTASIAGADLDAFFSVAGDVGRHELLLFDRSGAILGRSRSAPRRLPFTVRQADGRAGLPRTIVAGHDRWLVDRLDSPDNGPIYLAATTETTGTPETARLVLTQTARAIEAFLQRSPVTIRSQDAPSREAQLKELMLGRVANRQLDEHLSSLGIAAHEPLRVALFVSNEPGFDQHLRTSLSRDVRRHVAVLSAQELAVLLPEGSSAGCREELQMAVRGVAAVCLIFSEQQPNGRQAARAVAQARTLGRLCLSGAISADVIDASDPGETGLIDLLLRLYAPATFEPGRERLAAFVDDRLGALEAHDRDRGSDLVRTLAQYLEAGGSTTGAAQRLGIHRNTLGYRLARISELTGDDLDSADVRLNLGLALKIRELQRLLE